MIMKVAFSNVEPSDELDMNCVYVVDKDSKAAMSAMIKIAEQAKPGAIIPLTAEEFDAVVKRTVIMATKV